jgi:hypothetical protein
MQCRQLIKNLYGWIARRPGRAPSRAPSGASRQARAALRQFMIIAGFNFLLIYS